METRRGHSIAGPGLAWGLFFASLLLGLGAVVFTLALAEREPGDLTFAIGQGLLAAGYPAIGAVVAARLRGNPCGWLLIAIGLLQGLSNVTYPLGAIAAEASGNVRLVGLASVWLSNWVWFPSLGLLATFLLLLFPDGRLPSPRWRWFAWTAATVVLAGTVATAVGAIATLAPVPPTGVAPEAFTTVLFFALLLAGLGSVSSLVVRYRQSTGVQRQQLKWLALGGATALAGILLAFAPAESVTLPVALAMLLALPAAIAMAILRFRLYDIDRIISRTVGYVLLTGLLIAVYAAGVVLLRPVVGRVAGDSEAAVAISTITVAALFGPARRRIQSAVDRRFNRARYDAAAVVEQFSARLRDQVDSAALESDLMTVVRQTVAPRRASLWLRQMES